MSAAVAVAVVGGGGGGGGAAAITESKGSPVEEKTEDGHTEVARKKVGYADRMVGEWCANPAFAGVTDLRKGNHYYNSDDSATAVEKSGDVKRGTMSRIFRELRDLAGLSASGLVLTEDASMFLRCDELQPQYLRAVITGVSDTPYAYGCFAFDIFLPGDYPSRPPKCIHITPGTDKVYGNHTPGGMSPNLHRDSGKVCLSLLGTWDGPGWDPERSGLYQLLTAIAFQILAAEQPYYMEPGFGGWEGNIPSAHTSDVIEYKEEVQRGNLVCGILRPLSLVVKARKNRGRVVKGKGKDGEVKPHPEATAARAEMRSSPWFRCRDVMLQHFYFHRFNILNTCIEWYNETSCQTHKDATRFLALKILQQLTQVVTLLASPADATAYLAGQLNKLDATTMFSDAATSTEPAAQSNARGIPWRDGSLTAEKLRGMLLKELHDAGGGGGGGGEIGRAHV